MEEKDLSTVCEIENNSFQNPWSPITFLGEIQNDSISFPYVVVSRKNKKIVGYIICWHVKDEVQISNIAVHPNYRRRGLAEMVLHSVIEKFKEKGARDFVLEVRPSNQAALSLYKKMGFKVLGVKENYYHNPCEDAVVMKKSLEKR